MIPDLAGFRLGHCPKPRRIADLVCGTEVGWGCRRLPPSSVLGSFPHSYNPPPHSRHPLAEVLGPQHQVSLQRPSAGTQGAARKAEPGDCGAGASWASTPNARETWPDPPTRGSVRGRKGRSSPCLFHDSILGRGLAGWKESNALQARLAGCLRHIPPDSVTRGIAPPPLALPPSFQTRHHLPSTLQAPRVKVSI